MSHLLLVFVQLSPHLSGLLGYLCDGDAGVLRLDALAAGVQPQHVGAHRPLGASFVLLLLLLRHKQNRNVAFIEDNLRLGNIGIFFCCFLTSLRGFLSFFSFTTLAFLAFFFALSSSLSSPSSLLSLAEALLSYLIERQNVESICENANASFDLKLKK